MRSTTKINNANSLLYITRNFTNLNKVSTQLAMEQQVVELQDDPLSANIGVRMLNIISRTEQYNRNIKTGIGSLALTDAFLASAKSAMDKVKNISVGSANEPSDRSAAAIELNEILKSIVSTGNANDGTRYLFGGTHTTSAPFTIVNGRYVNYTGNDEKINIVADNGTTMPINSTGSQAYGNMITNIPSRDMNPDVSLGTDNSTRLSDLNAGSGVPKGKIMVYYSAYPEGLEVDLSNCDTLEDVKDAIEQQTLQASRDLDTAKHSWLNPNTMDWHDLQDRYVKVTINPEHNGISLQEFDRGEPLPEPNVFEQRKGVTYSGNTGYSGPGDYGVAVGIEHETTVYNKIDSIYNSKANTYYAGIRVDDFANNKVASALGIKGSANVFNPAQPDKVLDGFLHGRDLDPVLSDRTLLADLEGYNDSVYTITNGAKPGSIVISETSQDSGNVFNEWKLTGLSKGDNTGANGELYARVVNRGTATDPELFVEIYTCPIDKAKASDLVATGLYTEKDGGTVILNEANNSGLGGTVGIHLPGTIKEASVNLSVDFGDTLQASVHVPAFIEEQWPDGLPKDIFNIASGWDIRGLDKPPATGYDQNHPASTDLDGDVSVNYRYDSATNSFIVELSRPSFNDQPAKLIATGRLYLGDNNTPPTMGNAVSGRVEIVGAEGFEGVKGSVYLEVPAGANFSAAGTTLGASAADPTSLTYKTQANSVAGTVVFGGAVELQANQSVVSGFQLKGTTTFKKGQVFTQDILLPDGGKILAGTKLEHDLTLPKGVVVYTNQLVKGTVLAEGQQMTFTTDIAAGTVIPRGSYYTSGGGGFDATGMGMDVTKIDPKTGAVVTNGVEPMGYDLRATFATVEDLKRAVEEAGIYVTMGVSSDGKSLEFKSSLAGAYLTVSEDTDCYEQMGDKYQQLTGLDLNGLVKGVNSDKNGNVYTEVVYYPPEPTRSDGKALLIAEDGKQVLIDAGYYVRVYNDPDELLKPYQDRDNTKLMAEGYVASGTWNPAYDKTQPYDPVLNAPFLPANPPATLGSMNNLILEERNSSGLWGTVDLDYYGSKPVVTTDSKGNPVYDGYNNDGITVFPGGLRPEGSRHTTIQEWDMNNIIPGVTCDYTGTYHGTITGDATNPDGPAVALYKDSSHTVMTAKSVPPGTIVNGNPVPYMADGKVILYEVDRYGNLALDANKDPIVAGSMVVSENNLLDGQTDNFKLTTGANRNYGQEREENVFSTINDIMDAIHQADLETVHNLIGNIQKDIDRVLAATGDVGSRQKRMEILSERHADDVVRFKGMLTSRVGMDDQALAMAVLNYQAATNAYQAAMQVSATVMQMSLLQYI